MRKKKITRLVKNKTFYLPFYKQSGEQVLMVSLVMLLYCFIPCFIFILYSFTSHISVSQNQDKKNKKKNGLSIYFFNFQTVQTIHIWIPVNLTPFCVFMHDPKHLSGGPGCSGWKEGRDKFTYEFSSQQMEQQTTAYKLGTLCFSGMDWEFSLKEW